MECHLVTTRLDRRPGSPTQQSAPVGGWVSHSFWAGVNVEAPHWASAGATPVTCNALSPEVPNHLFLPFSVFLYLFYRKSPGFLEVLSQGNREKCICFILSETGSSCKKYEGCGVGELLAMRLES